MSATGRGRERNVRDYYQTPLWLCEAWADVAAWRTKSCDILDLCAGDGRIGAAMSRRLEQPWRGVDVEPQHEMVEKRDWREIQFPRVGMIVSNPPYSQANELVECCADWASKGGRIFSALLRLNFLGGTTSARPWLRHCPPVAIDVISPRPSFTPDGKTDACEYAIFWWGDVRGPAIGWVNK